MNSGIYKIVNVAKLISEFNSGECINILANNYLVTRQTILAVLSGRKWSDFNHLVDQTKWNKYKRKTICIV